ncbi:hypothetical protein ACW73L_05270 [Methylolobus aquaticus]
MATKSDFSTAEWQTLRDAPHLVVIAVAAAGGSGLFGSLKEAIAPAGGIVEALKGNNALLREVCAKEEIKAAIDNLKDQSKAEDLQSIQAVFRQRAIESSRDAVDILKNKGLSEDAAAYADFIKNLGDRVANAAKEGSFLGFGGERVSEPERILLTELAEALLVASA